MKKIIITGAAGTGKSTLAQRLAQKLHYPVIEFDDLYWRPGWTTLSLAEFAQRASEATAAERWIVTDPYALQRETVWARADAVIWIDLGFWQILRRIVRRSATRIRDKSPVCNGNIESWGRLFSMQGLPVWLVKFFLKKRFIYAKIFAKNRNSPQTAYIRLRTPDEIERFIETAI